MLVVHGTYSSWRGFLFYQFMTVHYPDSVLLEVDSKEQKNKIVRVAQETDFCAQKSSKKLELTLFCRVLRKMKEKLYF